MTPGRAGSDGWLPRWARRDRRELAILLGGVAALLLVVAFFVLAAKVIDGELQPVDRVQDRPAARQVRLPVGQRRLDVVPAAQRVERVLLVEVERGFVP